MCKAKIDIILIIVLSLMFLLASIFSNYIGVRYCLGFFTVVFILFDFLLNIFFNSSKQV